MRPSPTARRRPRRRLPSLLLSLALLSPAACEDEPTAPPPTAGTPAPKRPLSAREVKECRDRCEQAQLGEGIVDDAALRACRARCEGQGAHGAAAAGNLGPHEVPRSVTRAPAVRSAPAVRPISQ